MQPLENEMQDVFREVFGDDQLQIHRSTTASDIGGWDSLTHLNLIIALEKRFGVRFATAEISRLKKDGSNVGTLFDMIHGKIS